MPRLARPAVLALLAPLALALTAAPAQAATCAKRSGEIKRKAGGVLWAKSGSLYLCTAYYGEPPVTRKIGPWSGARSNYAFDGSSVVWTQHLGGPKDVAEDRVWAADGPTEVWLRGLKPVTGITGAIDVNVDRMVVLGEAAAWITAEGQVVMAVHDPDGEPELVGAGTPGAAAPVVPGVTDSDGWGGGDVIAYRQGLLPAPLTKGKRRLLGRWTALAGPALNQTLRLRISDSEGDECGGVSTYEATVRPIAGEPRVGYARTASWASERGACS